MALKITKTIMTKINNIYCYNYYLYRQKKKKKDKKVVKKRIQKI